MKKALTLIAAAVVAVAANAKDFTDNIVISLTGMEPTSQESVITVDEVENSDGLYDITLNDFSFGTLSLGDIKVESIKGDSDSDGLVYFEETTQTTTVSFGGIPMSVDITIKDGSRMNDDKLYLDMSITALGSLVISAVFGDDNFPVKYTDNMVVDLGYGNSDPMSATIIVEEQSDGKYTLSLENFVFDMGGGVAFGIGDITVSDVEGTDEDGKTVLSGSDLDVIITDGDTPDVDWSFGQQMADVGIKATISGEMTDDKLNVRIELSVVNIVVLFGEDYITSGISSVTTTVSDGVEAIYDLSGKKLNELQKGVNIVRKADGTTFKVLKK